MKKGEKNGKFKENCQLIKNLDELKNLGITLERRGGFIYLLIFSIFV